MNSCGRGRGFDSYSNEGAGGRRGLSVRSNIIQSATSRDNFQQRASSRGECVDFSARFTIAGKRISALSSLLHQRQSVGKRIARTWRLFSRGGPRWDFITGWVAVVENVPSLYICIQLSLVGEVRTTIWRTIWIQQVPQTKQRHHYRAETTETKTRNEDRLIRRLRPETLVSCLHRLNSFILHASYK